MKRPLLLALGLVGLCAQAADYNAFVAIGGAKTTGGSFPVLCDPAGCFDSFFGTAPGEVVAVAGAMDDGVVAFDGWAEGWHSSLLALHAGAGLSVTGSDGVEGHRWFANSQVMLSTTLVSYWSDPDDAQIRLFYRFDGSSTASATGAAEAESYGRGLRQHAGPAGPGLPAGGRRAGPVHDRDPRPCVG